MKRKILKFIVLTISVLVMTLIFAVPTFADEASGDVLDGIYTIRNDYTDTVYISQSTYYLRSQLTYSSTSLVSVAQHSQNNFGDLTNQLYNYWRITHLGNGEYVIRSLADESKALALLDGSVTLSEIGTTVPTSARWYITSNYIKPVSNTSKCLILSSSAPSGAIYSEGVYYNYFNLSVNTIGDMAFEKWTFEEAAPSGIVIRDDNNGMLYSSKSIIANLSTGAFEITDLNYSILAYVNGTISNISWSYLNNAVATVDGSGTIIPLSVGTTTIYASINVSDSNPNKNITFTLNISNSDFEIILL